MLLPQTPGSRRVVPLVTTAEQGEHLRALLTQSEWWVRRSRWYRWLHEGKPSDTSPIDVMGRDDRVAALSWLRQQRHVLYRVLEGETRAPEGWVEALPLFQALDAD